MKDALFLLLALGGSVAVAAVCALSLRKPISVVWPIVRNEVNRFRQMPPLSKVALIVFVGAFVVYGSTKTNLVDQTSGTNIVICASSPGGRISVKCAGGEVGGGVSGDAFHGNASTDVPPTVTPEDIARGWRLWEVRTNCNISYTMPEGATLASNWWVRGAYEDVKEMGLGGAVASAGRGDRDGTDGEWRFQYG